MKKVPDLWNIIKIAAPVIAETSVKIVATSAAGPVGTISAVCGITAAHGVWQYIHRDSQNTENAKESIAGQDVKSAQVTETPESVTSAHQSEASLHEEGGQQKLNSWLDQRNEFADSSIPHDGPLGGDSHRDTYKNGVTITDRFQGNVVVHQNFDEQGSYKGIEIKAGEKAVVETFTEDQTLSENSAGARAETGEDVNGRNQQSGVLQNQDVNLGTRSVTEPSEKADFKNEFSDGSRLSPVHYSERFGVHADIEHADHRKEHVPYAGQTTLETFDNRGSWANDQRLADLGGSLQNESLNPKSNSDEGGSKAVAPQTEAHSSQPSAGESLTSLLRRDVDSGRNSPAANTTKNQESQESIVGQDSKAGEGAGLSQSAAPGDAQEYVAGQDPKSNLDAVGSKVVAGAPQGETHSCGPSAPENLGVPHRGDVDSSKNSPAVNSTKEGSVSGQDSKVSPGTGTSQAQTPAPSSDSQATGSPSGSATGQQGQDHQQGMSM